MDWGEKAFYIVTDGNPYPESWQLETVKGVLAGLIDELGDINYKVYTLHIGSIYDSRQNQVLSLKNQQIYEIQSL